VIAARPEAAGGLFRREPPIQLIGEVRQPIPAKQGDKRVAPLRARRWPGSTFHAGAFNMRWPEIVTLKSRALTKGCCKVTVNPARSFFRSMLLNCNRSAGIRSLSLD
jgi:hypothetical protein